MRYNVNRFGDHFSENGDNGARVRYTGGMDEMTVAEAAVLLNRSRRQVQHLIQLGTLSGRRIGERVYLVERASVERYARECRRGRPPNERVTA